MNDTKKTTALYSWVMALAIVIGVVQFIVEIIAMSSFVNALPAKPSASQQATITAALSTYGLGIAFAILMVIVPIVALSIHYGRVKSIFFSALFTLYQIPVILSGLIAIALQGSLSGTTTSTTSGTTNAEMIQIILYVFEFILFGLSVATMALTKKKIIWQVFSYIVLGLHFAYFFVAFIALLVALGSSGSTNAGVAMLDLFLIMFEIAFFVIAIVEVHHEPYTNDVKVVVTDSNSAETPTVLGSSVEARLAQIDDLYKKGLINEQQRDNKKAEILKNI